MVARGVVGLGQVRIQPQGLTIVLDRRVLIAQASEARAEVLVDLEPLGRRTQGVVSASCPRVALGRALLVSRSHSVASAGRGRSALRRKSLRTNPGSLRAKGSDGED